jgi:hypothetical protein
MDIFKNVNINGQGASFEGSTIAFNIPQQSPASEAFIFQGVMVAQPLPQNQPIQVPTLPQPETTQEIQSVVVKPPTRQPPTPIVEAESVQETEASESAQPPSPQTVAKPNTTPTETTEEPLPPSRVESTVETPPAVTTPVIPTVPIDASANNASQTAINTAQTTTDSSGDNRATTERGAVDNHVDFDEAAREIAREQGAEIQSEEAQAARDAARESGAEIQSKEAQAARDAARESGAGIQSEEAEAAREIARAPSASAMAYKAAYLRRKELEKSDPDYDRESDVRQKGETTKEFRERKEELALEQDEREKQEKLIERIKSSGDLSQLPTGMVAVRFTRADGAKKIITLVATEFVGIVEGATVKERTATMPSENSYYEAGGGSSCVGLALYKKTVGTAPSTTTQVWVGAGTVAGQVPSGFDPADGKSIASGGSGSVWAEVNINGTTGDIVSVAVAGGGTTPNNTDTSFYYPLGYYEYDGNSPSVTNYGCGSIDVTVCRNWFANKAPFYGVSMSRTGV